MESLLRFHPDKTARHSKLERIRQRRKRSRRFGSGSTHRSSGEPFVRFAIRFYPGPPSCIDGGSSHPSSCRAEPAWGPGGRRPLEKQAESGPKSHVEAYRAGGEAPGASLRQVQDRLFDTTAFRGRLRTKCAENKSERFPPLVYRASAGLERVSRLLKARAPSTVIASAWRAEGGGAKLYPGPQAGLLRRTASQCGFC